MPLPLLLLLLLLVPSNASSPSCSTTTCGNHTITYPFSLLSTSNPNPPPYCGYPDLGLLCENNTTLILPIQSHNYTVSRIDYSTHTISLADADTLLSPDCPRLHRNLTILPTPWLNLTPSDSNLILLYNCSRNDIPTLRSAVKIECLEYENSYVLPAGEVPGELYESYECSEVVVAPVRGDYKIWVRGGTDYARVVDGGFQLSWNRSSAPCGQCEDSGGSCGYNLNETSHLAFTCFCPHGPSPHHCGGASSKRREKIYITAGMSSLFVLCLFLFTCFLYYEKSHGLLAWKKGSKNAQRIESFLQKHGMLRPKRYTYSEVKRMTKSFAHKLGQGGYGAVYKGNLPDGHQIAVKMLKESKGDGEEFMNEVASISRTSHVNIVTLLGFCLQGSKRALIYDYMPNGSLERFAFSNNSQGENSLSWEKLFEIAVGIARGLEYLHRGCSTRIVHFDIKPHNILLDQDFCPKISDFGLAKLCLPKESIIISIAGARGTIGYIAPEVFSRQFGAVTSKSDVYSYGMMVLEMVGARKNINVSAEASSEYFPQWIYEHLDQYCVNACEISGETTELARKMIIVGLWCIQVMPTDRPSMSRVIEMLENSTRDLQLPPKSLLN